MVAFEVALAVAVAEAKAAATMGAAERGGGGEGDLETTQIENTSLLEVSAVGSVLK